MRGIQKKGEPPMTSIYDNYGERAREKLKENYDLDSVMRDIGWAERDIKEIAAFITAAKAQIEIIKDTQFRRYIKFEKGHDHYRKKVEFSVSVYRVPQVAGNENLRVFESDINVSRRWVGNEHRKEAIEHAHALMERYPDAELIGNAADLLRKRNKEVLQV
jgi:hypothetical protein